MKELSQKLREEEKEEGEGGTAEEKNNLPAARQLIIKTSNISAGTGGEGRGDQWEKKLLGERFHNISSIPPFKYAVADIS